MKKTIQIAFAITLLLLSVVSSFVRSQLFTDIIYAIILPSFFLTIISFVNSIVESCKKSAEATAKTYQDKATSKTTMVGALLLKDRNDKAFNELIDKSTENTNQALKYYNLGFFYMRCQKILSLITIMSYVFLFLSLILSPYIIRLLSGIDLGCLTLWSLTILYFDSELKEDLSKKCFSFLTKMYFKKTERQI